MICMYQRTIIIISFIIFFLFFFTGCIDFFQNGEYDEKSTLFQCAEIIDKGFYPKITQAIENASAGDTIIIYDGVYNETLDISKKLTLQAYINHHPIIQYTNEEDGILLTISAPFCLIDGLTLQNLPTLNKSYIITGIKINGQNTKVFNTTIQQFHYGIQISNEINFNTFSFNSIKNNTEGAEIIYSKENIFTYNNISNNTRYGLYFGYQSNNNIISNNIFYNNEQPVQLKTAYYNTVTRNTLIKNILNISECCGAEGKNTIKNNIIQ